MNRQIQACKHCGSGSFHRVCRRCKRDGLDDTVGKRMQVGDMLKQLNIVIVNPNSVLANAAAQLLASKWGARVRR